MRQPISRNPTQDVAPMTAIRPNDRSLLARTPVDPTLSSCVPHSAIAATAPGEGSSSDEDAAPTGAAILIEHYTLWPPLHCGEEPAAPRFPPRPLGDASRPIVAADSPNADGVGTVMLPVFDPEEARARLLELGVDDDLEEDLFDGATLPAKITSLGAEESRRAKLLSRLAQDSQNGCRAALVGDEVRVAAIREVAQEAPNFQSALLPVANALALSARTRRPASIPPLLLLGPPGIGKTHVAKRLAAAIGVPYRLLSMNLSPAFGQIGGLDLAWRGARPGKVAQALIETGSASPLILFDEIDKPMVGTPRETPWDALHSLFEPENAVAFRDEYCDMAFDARHLVSIATANDIDALPVSLVDRLLVVDVQPPTLEQRRLIAATLYVRQQAEAADVLAPELEPDTLDALAALSPRRIARTIALAIAHAVGHSRDRLSADDVRAAAALVRGRSGEPGQRFGFVPGP